MIFSDEDLVFLGQFCTPCTPSPLTPTPEIKRDPSPIPSFSKEGPTPTIKRVPLPRPSFSEKGPTPEIKKDPSPIPIFSEVSKMYFEK